MSCQCTEIILCKEREKRGIFSPHTESKGSEGNGFLCFYVNLICFLNSGAVTDHPRIDALVVTCFALFFGKHVILIKINALVVTCFALFFGKHVMVIKIDALVVTCFALFFGKHVMVIKIDALVNWWLPASHSSLVSMSW